MSQKSEPNIIYFLPGQLIFHVSETMSGPGASAKLQEMLYQANTLAEKFADGRSMILSASSEDALDFNPPSDPSALPLVGTRQKEAPTGSSYISPTAKLPVPFSLVVAKAESKKWPKFPTEDADQQDALGELLDLAIHLNEHLSEIGAGNLMAVSPNWLMSGSPSSPGSTGGPGAQPVPYKGNTGNQDYLFHSDFLPKMPEPNFSGGLGEENVVVAILDTAPKLRDGENAETVLDRIYSEWARKGHLLIDSLLGSQRKLTKIYLDASVDRPIPGVRQDGQPQDGYIEVAGHDYEMTDHGLFAAGIIHSLAPQAELHLFQVLNRYGVGDLLSIARALKHIHDDHKNFPKNRLLVNLSLTINIPFDKPHGKKDGLSKKISDYISTKNAGNPKDKDGNPTDTESVHQAQIIEWICNSLYAQGAKVIAAAGNNREPGGPKPLASYPAAFESVLGVGALPRDEKPGVDATKKFKTSSYSNRADKPEWTGITTLGGEAGENNGVLGIYVGEFPKDASGTQAKNDKGWAWWAGTSFATPIITGITAAVRNWTPGLNTMEDAVVKLFKAQSFQTDVNEDVFYVTQGPQST